MEKFFRIFFVSVVSILLVSGIMYASSTIISVQTQSIAQGDVIANGWFQEVNDSIVSIRNTLTSNTGNLWGKSGNDIYYTGGNVGIGTNNPNNKLQIGKGLDSTGSLLLARNSTSNDLGVYETYDGTDNFKLENQTGIFGYGVRPYNDAWQIWERGYNLNWTNYFTVTKTGNIGINNQSPLTKLDITGKSDNGIRVTAEGKLSTAYLHIAGGDYGYLALSSLSGVELPTDTVLRSGGNESRIGGKVSINGSSPINPDVRAIYGASLEYPYYYEITVNGDKDTFYPIALTQGWTGRVPGKFIIARTYPDDGPTGVSGQPSTAHKGGLMASFSTEGSCWSDYCYIILERYRTTYIRLIADAGQLPAADSANHVIWIRLRGGGFKYRIYANWAADPIQPSPGSTAYNQNGYIFNYPGTINYSSLVSNAFATNQNLPTENLQ